MSPRIAAVKTLILAVDQHEKCDNQLSNAVAVARAAGVSWITIRHVLAPAAGRKVQLEWDRPPAPRIRLAKVTPAVPG
jgi:hypothetical protein